MRINGATFSARWTRISWHVHGGRVVDGGVDAMVEAAADVFVDGAAGALAVGAGYCLRDREPW